VKIRPTLLPTEKIGTERNKTDNVGFEVLTAVSMKIAVFRADDGGSKDL
jgi:hypothetical protein